jgi:V/A-type H+-transporting ATPase subunit K
MENNKKRLQKKIVLSMVVLISILTIFSMITGVRIFAQESVGAESAAPAAGTAAGAVITPEKATVSKFAFIAAAVAFGLGALGAGLAIGNVGSAAMGAVAEKPEVAGQALIFVALAEGLVIFGFITALMILGKV